MKKRCFLGIPVILLVFGLFFAGCKQEPAVEYSNDARLTSILLNGEAGQLGEGIPDAEWINGLFDFTTMPLSHLYFDDKAALADAAVEVTPANSAASIYYGLGKDYHGPESWSRSGTFTNLTTADFVYVRVTSEDRKNRFYYKVQIHLKSSNASLSLLMVNGRVASIRDENSSTADPLSADPVNLIINYGIDSVDSPITVRKQDEGQIVQFAKVEYGSSDQPEFSDLTTFTFGDGDVLYAKVTSSDSTVTRYYAVNLIFTNLISSIAIGSQTAGAAAAGFGDLTANVGTTGGFRGAMGISSANAAAGTVIKAVPAPETGALVTGYALNTGNTPTFTDPAEDGSYTTTAAITNNGQLRLQVQSRTGSLYYYRIVITIQSNVPTLTAVTVGGTEASSIGTAQTAPWAGTGNAGAALITPAAASPNDTTIATTAANNAAVRSWAVAADANIIPADTDFSSISPIAGGIGDGKYLFVKSVSQDGSATLYYKLAVTVKNNVATLASVAIDSTAAALPSPGTSWANALALGKVYASAPSTVTLSAAASDSNAVVKYAVSTDGSSPDTDAWSTSQLSISNPASGTYIAAQVTAENGTTINYYRWRIGYGSNAASLQASAAVNITGVPNSTLGVPSDVYNGSAITSGTMYLNSTQTANGKSIVVFVNENDVDEVAFSTTNTTSDGANPPTWAVLTKDSVNTKKWTGAWSGTALANGRRFYIRLTAADKVTQKFYRFQVTVNNNYAVLSGLTVNSSTVAAADWGTPAGSWDAGGFTVGSIILDQAFPITPTVNAEWNSLGTGMSDTVTYAVTSSLTNIPSFGALPASINSGDYLWIQNITSGGTGEYRNVYVFKVGLQPWTVNFGSKVLSWANKGASFTGTTFSFNQNPSNMGYILLTEAEMTNLTVTASTAGSEDTIKVVKAIAPNSGTAISRADFSSAGSSIASGDYSGKDHIQIQYTPGGGSAVYYAIYIRKAVDIPYVAAGTINMNEAAANETAWSSAAELTIDRVYNGDSGGLAGSNFDQNNPSTIKVLWSDDGIYYFANVADNSESMGGDHNYDNIEFFLSEDYTFGEAGNWNTAGGQYRVGRSGTISGDTPARVTAKVTSTASGYTIKARIAWAAAAATVAAWNNKLIGLEPQIAYSTGNTRNAVVMWNNFLNGSYQQKANTGIGYLRKH